MWWFVQTGDYWISIKKSHKLYLSSMTEFLALPKITQEIFPLYNHVLEQCQNQTCGWSQPSIPHLLTAEVGKTIRGQNVSHTHSSTLECSTRFTFCAQPSTHYFPSALECSTIYMFWNVSHTKGNTLQTGRVQTGSVLRERRGLGWLRYDWRAGLSLPSFL